MQNFRNLEASGGWSENVLTNPKRHILGLFYAFRAIDRANPFTGFCSRRVHEKRTLQKVTETLYFTYLQGIPHPNETKFN